MVDPLDRIKKLKELLDSGAITQEEYNKKKKRIIRIDNIVSTYKYVGAFKFTKYSILIL